MTENATSPQSNNTGYASTTKLPGIFTMPQYCCSRHIPTPDTTPAAIPRRVISQPSSTMERRTRAFEAPIERNIPRSSFFSIINIERLPKMLKQSISTTKSIISQTAAFS